MESLHSTEDFYRYKALHYEALVGDKKDRESVKVNDQYRIEFRSEVVDNEKKNGRRPVTTTSALIFEAALDIPADSLLKMQMKYNMSTAKKDNALLEKLRHIRRIAAAL